MALISLVSGAWGGEIDEMYSSAPCPIVVSVLWPWVQRGNSVRQLSIYREEQWKTIEMTIGATTGFPHQRQRGVGSSGHILNLLKYIEGLSKQPFIVIHKQVFSTSLAIVHITSHRLTLTHFPTTHKTPFITDATKPLNLSVNVTALKRKHVCSSVCKQTARFILPSLPGVVRVQWVTWLGLDP